VDVVAPTVEIVAVLSPFVRSPVPQLTVGAPFGVVASVVAVDGMLLPPRRYVVCFTVGWVGALVRPAPVADVAFWALFAFGARWWLRRFARGPLETLAHAGARALTMS
jgi:uncharacterized protein DUF418